MSSPEIVQITVILPAGRLPLEIMSKAQELAGEHNLEIFLTTAQNLRLLRVPVDKVEEVKAPLAELGAKFKVKGTFPKPRVCVGAPHCPAASGNTEELTKAIMNKFSDRGMAKPKFKIAIGGCSIGCSNPRTSDIGIVATKKGYDLFLGGKGGPKPAIGVCVKKALNEEELLETMSTVIDYHQANTEKKGRIANLMGNDDFPFAAIED